MRGSSWSATEAQNYEDYVSKLGTAETDYATSDAGQFTDEVKAIDAVDQADGDAAADADQTLTNTLGDDETEVEQSAAGADNIYWVAVAQANHDYRVAATQAWHDVEVGGSSADYNTAMTAAANNQSLGLNAAIAQFHATVDPVVAITGQTDINATLTDDTSIADLSLDDFTKSEQAQNKYSDLESGDYATQQKADNQAEHDLTVNDANAEASAMAAFAQANPSPWADEAAAEAQAKATRTIAAADAELTVANDAADDQAAQEIAGSDAAAARDIAYATQMHDQSVASAQKVHDLSTPTGVGVPDAISPPIDGTPPALRADYGGGFEAGNLWLPDTTEDFMSLPLEVPSGGEMEEPDAPGLVTDMALGAMPVNGQQPYYGMLYGQLIFSSPEAYLAPGLVFFDGTSADATTSGNSAATQGQTLAPGSLAALAGTNWSNGLATAISTATQPGPSGPSFFQAPGGGGGGGYVPGGGSTNGGSSSGGGTVVGKAPQQEQGPTSAQAPPPKEEEGIAPETGDAELENTVRNGEMQKTADGYAGWLRDLRSVQAGLGRAIDSTSRSSGVSTTTSGFTIDWKDALGFLKGTLADLETNFANAGAAAADLYNGTGGSAAVQTELGRIQRTLDVTRAYLRVIQAAIWALNDSPRAVTGEFGFAQGAIDHANALYDAAVRTLNGESVNVDRIIGDANNYVDRFFSGIQAGANIKQASQWVGMITGIAGLFRTGAVLLAVAKQGGGTVAAELYINGQGLLALKGSGGLAITLTKAQATELATSGVLTVGGFTVYAKAVDPSGLGKAGEDAVPGTPNTERIPSASGRASYRVPDRKTDVTIEEIKNVLKLENRSQLRDYLAYAQKTGRTFTLWVRGNAKGAQTVLDQQLLDLVKKRQIAVRAIPGTGSWIGP